MAEQNSKVEAKSNDAFTLHLFGAQGKLIKLKNIRKTMLVKEVKSLYLNEYANIKGRMIFKYNAKQMLDDKTLSFYGCNDGLLPVFIVFRVCGGPDPFEKYNSDWQVMYERCPVCVFANRNKRHKLPKGYWRHDSGDKCAFVTKKPSDTFIVETKQYYIRCHNCKKECDGFNYMYKCPNHDYQKLKVI